MQRRNLQITIGWTMPHVAEVATVSSFAPSIRGQEFQKFIKIK